MISLSVKCPNIMTMLQVANSLTARSVPRVVRRDLSEDRGAPQVKITQDNSHYNKVSSVYTGFQCGKNKAKCLLDAA